MKMIEYENLNKLNAQFESDFKQSFNSFLEKGWYILGKSVNKFEIEFSKYISTKYCIGVASGLDALTLSIKSLDFPKGAEIHVPSNTNIASILAIIICGFKPVLWWSLIY